MPFVQSLIALATVAVPCAFASKSTLEYAFPAQPGLDAFSVTLGPDPGSVCNSSTPGTSGFITTQDGDNVSSSIFFWSFESKNDPETDPVILWMTGGPGASSVGYGNLMELGPCRIAPEGGYTIENDFSWNANATVLFVDQPAGVGFSRSGRMPSGLLEASETMDRFLRQFMTAFPELAERDFYIAGESYGGSWVPALAATISGYQTDDLEQADGLRIQGNELRRRQRTEHAPKINLKGIMIGNGLIRQSVQNQGFFETVCSSPGSLFNSSQCEEWAPTAMWCVDNLQICETAGQTSAACKEAQERCSGISKVVIGEMHRNPYDFRQRCDDPSACYAEMPHIDEYLNQAHVKDALGVPEDREFVGISMDVFRQWEKVGDLWRRSDHYVNYLLREGIRVLIYVGDQDLYCNSAGMRLLVGQGLSWYGQPFMRFRDLMPWFVGTKPAGHWKSYGPLTYAEIADGGHLVPFDKGEESLVLINSWIEGRLQVT